jgi:hypothetical protein
LLYEKHPHEKSLVSSMVAVLTGHG